MRRFVSKAVAFLATMVVTLTLLGSPAKAAAVGCRGECTTGAILANASGHFIDVHIYNDGIAWCSWVVRDAGNQAIVGQGTLYDGQSHPRINGLYNAYYLFVSNFNCYGQIENVS
jgi:hypothetical protein